MEIKIILESDFNKETFEYSSEYDSMSMDRQIPRIGEKLAWKFNLGDVCDIKSAVVKDVIHLGELGSYNVLVIVGDFESKEIDI